MALDNVVSVCIQYITRNEHMVNILLCFMVVLHKVILLMSAILSFSGSYHHRHNALSGSPDSKEPWIDNDSKHQSDTSMSDRCLIDANLRAFDILEEPGVSW